MHLKKFCLIWLSISTLSACSAPTPPAISGKAEPINHQTSITPLEPEVVTVIQSKPITRHYRLYYPYNIATTSRSPLLHDAILPEGRTAQRIRIIGRTDGRYPSKQDQWIAKQRAINIRNYLVARGISPERIDVNYAAATDYIADNTTKTGRENNRRVDVEIIWESN